MSTYRVERTKSNLLYDEVRADEVYVSGGVLVFCMLESPVQAYAPQAWYRFYEMED